jgi:hypothetical protein
MKMQNYGGSAKPVALLVDVELYADPNTRRRSM